MQPALIRFGDISIDPARRELRRDGQRVAIQNRAFDLLLYLVENRDRAVSKEELQERLWPGVIVTETALSRAVMKARRAVGDDAADPSVIRTMHGHGYRFVASLQEQEARTSSTAAATAGDSAGSDNPHRWRQALPALGLAVLLALVTVASLLLFHERDQSNLHLAVLPVQVPEDEPELAWASLGLMAYANQLLREGSGAETSSARDTLQLPQAEAQHWDDEARLQTLRGTLNASHLLSSRLLAENNQLLLEWRVAHSGGVSQTESTTGTDAVSMAGTMARRVLATLPGGAGIDSLRSISADPFVNEAYARGLDANLKGDVSQARDYLAAAVRRDPELFWPRYELALAQRDLGDLQEARTTLTELLAKPGIQRDQEMRAAANNAMGQVHWRLREYAEAERSYEQALDAGRLQHDLEVEQTVLINLGILTRIQGRYDDSRRHLTRALALSQDGGPPASGFLYQSLGQLERATGQPVVALDYYHRAAETFNEDGNRRGAAAAMNAGASLEIDLGRMLEAEPVLREALAIRRELGDYYGQLSSLSTLCELHADLEQWPEASQLAAELALLAENDDSNEAPDEADRLLARIALGQGNTQAARDTLDRWAGRSPDARQELSWQLLQARWLASVGRSAEGHQLLMNMEEPSSPAARVRRLLAIGEVSQNAGEREKWLRQALALADQHQQLQLAGQALVALLRDQREGRDAEAARLAQDFADWPQTRELLAGSP